MEKASVRTDVGYRTTIETERHNLYADVSVGAGGTDTAPNPEELLLGALGSCTVQTLHMYADRKGWDLKRVEVDLEFEKQRASEVKSYDGSAKFVHSIHKKIRIFGELDADQRARLMEISKKCPVHRILEGPTHITQEEILPEEA